MKNGVKLFLSLAITLATGALASLFNRGEITTWYTTIQKPGWRPPNWLFAPVWTLLYILMGIALYLVWKSKHPFKRTALWLFAVQLVLNFFWSFIFFKQHQIGLALAEIILLWIFILLTIFAFARIHKGSAWLLVPYISWVSFAGILTFAIWQLNR